MILPEEQRLLHFKCGIALVPSALDLEDGALLFAAAGQINRAGPSAVQDSEQSILISNLNLRAGVQAMKMTGKISFLLANENLV